MREINHLSQVYGRIIELDCVALFFFPKAMYGCHLFKISFVKQYQEVPFSLIGEKQSLANQVNIYVM